jgi:prefoldin subunit 1
MATLSDETLRKVCKILLYAPPFHAPLQILVQIQQTAIQSQRALNLSLQQTAAKDRERRILQLTIDEISQMKGDVNLYRGVGKMYIL